jgi:uncharacterized cupin superfamily protein
VADAGITKGDGFALASLEALGEGPGFRKVREALGVTAFGVNGIVLPPGEGNRWHRHERQEELYFVHRGEVALELGDGSEHRLGPGGVAWVDAATDRRLRNVGDGEAVVLVVGGAGGYVGRDGVLAERS